MKEWRLLSTVVLIIFSTVGHSQLPKTMSPKDQSIWVDSMISYRMTHILPELMTRAGIDMWVLISREYNEDPVMKTMLPSTWMGARRRTIMVFYNPGQGGPLEKIAIARYDVGKILKAEWYMKTFPNQWDALMDVINKYNPKKIGINISENYAHADGMVHTEMELFMKYLPEAYKNRIVSAEKLAVGWLETRSPMEIEFYKFITDLGRKIIKTGFSEKFIVVGETSTEDIIWRLRELAIELGLEVWFHPTVAIQRADANNDESQRNFAHRPPNDIVQYGDLIHVDFGIVYNRLYTDQQQHFYVLKPGEKSVPEYLKKVMDLTNRLQDILTDEFKTGRSGNEILLSALSKAKAEGITPSIYSHPLGSHGHAAGPTIGMWDAQNGVEGSGDYLLYPNTAYSIELNTTHFIKEWDKSVRIMLEENGYFDGNKFYYLAGRQTEIYPLKLKK